MSGKDEINDEYKFNKEPLYVDDKLKIDYHPTSPNDHILYIQTSSDKSNEGKELGFVLPRGCLDTFAMQKRGDLETRLNAFDEMIISFVKEEKIGINGLHVAFSQAYAEYRERLHKYMIEELREKGSGDSETIKKLKKQKSENSTLIKKLKKERIERIQRESQ